MIQIRAKWNLLPVLLVFGLGFAASGEAQSLLIPSESDWIDIGRVLSPGGSGAWDKHLGDDGTGTQGMASPSALIKKDGMYFLYYLGADGLRSSDGGVRHRSLGVATSQDGMNFTKFSGNPIIEFLPHNNEEEGIYSATAYLDSNDDVVLYYGAMDAGSSSSHEVKSDIRLAISSDGFDFTEIGEVASHDDDSVWGHGDELFPVYTLESDGTHWVYYLAKGDGATWDLGAVWGPTISQLNSSGRVLKLSPQIRGGSASMLIDDDKMIFPVLLRSGSSNWDVQMRSAPLNDPTNLSTTMDEYDWNQVETLLVYLDRDVGQWFLYYVDRAATGIYMKTASAGTVEPPTEFTLTVDRTGSGSGTVVSSPVGIDCGSDCAETFPDQSVVQLVSTADSGSEFGGWTGPTDCQDGLVTMVSDLTCTAIFDLLPPAVATLTVSLAGNGSGGVTSSPAGIDCGADCIEDYPLGTAVQLVTNADPGSEFSGWSGHIDCQDGSVTMADALLCTANFDLTNNSCSEQIEITSWSTAPDTTYRLADALAGSRIYTDRSYAITNIPTDLEGQTLLQTANSDKYVSVTEHLQLNLCRPLTVYVAMDRRTTSPPDWLLEAGWSQSSMSLDTSDTAASPMPLYEATFPAGELLLGGNYAGGESGAHSNYILIVDTNSLSQDGFESGDFSGWDCYGTEWDYCGTENE